MILRTLLLAGLLLFAVSPTAAKFYKYVDKSGQIRYTDDITAIPQDQRSKIREYDEYKNEPASTLRQPEPESATESAASRIDDQPISEQELLEMQARLDKKRAQLDDQYKELMEERQALEQMRSNVRNRTQMRAYEAQVMQFNEKNAAFKAQQSAFESDVAAYEKKTAAFEQMMQRRDQ
jgi:hypothetical protein